MQLRFVVRSADRTSDYFATGQQATIEGAQGAGMSAEALVALTTAQAGSKEATKQDFRLAARGPFFAAQLYERLQPVDGTTLAKHHYPSILANKVVEHWRAQ